MSVGHLDSCDCCDSLWLLTQLTPCSYQCCIVGERRAAVRAVTLQPENEQLEYRRGFLRRDEENPCDSAEDIWWRFCELHWAQQLGFCVGSIYTLSIGNHTIGLINLYSVYWKPNDWFEPYLPHMPLVPVHTPRGL